MKTLTDYSKLSKKQVKEHMQYFAEEAMNDLEDTIDVYFTGSLKDKCIKALRDSLIRELEFSDVVLAVEDF